MYKQPSNGMKLGDIKKAYFIGIGGIGMSGLARLFLHEGIEVYGSDRTLSPITDALKNEGVAIYPLQGAQNIFGDEDVVIYTEALSKDDDELAEARLMNVPTMNYFEALGMVANEYYLIAVAGSHGKTTTTAMLIDIFEEAGFDPSAIVGSLRSKSKSNYRAGKSKYFIVEACEYKRDFLSLEPDVLAITNIEHEHVDYYKDLEAVQKAFREFAEKVPNDGFVIANLSDPNISPVISGLSCTIIDYSKYVHPLRKLTMPGIHNQLNAGAAVAAAAKVGITEDVCERALSQFGGTWRRFEYKGEYNGAKIYDDYGHHPTEIRATLQGARELYPDKAITLVFQPHTYSRMHELFGDFVAELSKADHVMILPIYAAREENISGVTHTQLVEAIREINSNVIALDTHDAVIKKLKSSVSGKDVVLVMGAGDVTTVASTLVL